MGEQRRWVISVDEETHLLAEQWQADFSPLVGSNRSSLVRLVFKTLNRLGFTAETLTAALAQPQQLRQAKLEQSVAELNNLSHNEFPAFPSIGQEKKPLTRATHRRVAREGQAIHGVNRRSYLGAGVRLAWLCPPFRATKSPLKSNSFRQVA